jgi:thiol:disulfide interchange protein DsbC
MTALNVQRALLAGAITLGLTAGAASLAAVPESPELAAVHALVSKKLGGHEVVSVALTPVKGVYEVVLAPPQIIYTDAQAKYVLTGPMIDLDKQANLTEARLAALTRIDFSTLPLDKAIKTVKGNGSRKLAIFSDPDCPYCKRLEEDTLAKVNNVTIYTFLCPLDQHTDAARKAGVIWCAPDRARAWNDWMQSGKLPANAGTCANPIQANLALGKKLGVSATPTLILAQGDVVPGAIGREALEAKLGK